RSALYLFARNRPDIGNVPAYVRERFYSRDDPNNEKRDLNERSNDCPEKHEDTANPRNRAEDRVHHRGGNIKKKPCPAKNDRLHRVEAHERVVFFENIKNDTADQWNAGDRSSH